MQFRPVDRVRLIAEAPVHERDRMTHDFLKDFWPLFVRIAHGFCRQTGKLASSHLDDFTSIVAERASLMIQQAVEDPSTLSKINIWEAMLKAQCRNAVRDWLRVNDQPATGMSAKLRLTSQLHALKWKMAADLGREPSDQEVVDENNRLMHQNYKNPRKNSVIADIDDMSTEKHTADVEDHQDLQEIEYECILSPIEGKGFLRDVSQAAWSKSPQLGTATAIWLEHAYEGEERSQTTKTIAKALGISAKEVPALVSEIRQLAENVLHQSLGIAREDI